MVVSVEIINSMTDFIDNIQEKMSGAMLAVSSKSGAMSAVSNGVRLAAATESSNSCFVFRIARQ
jgi:hypothetical protein